MILTNLLILLCSILIFSVEGWIDGNTKKTGVMNHYPKILSFIALCGFIVIPKLLYPVPLLMILPILLIRKPIMDYSWSIGNGNKQIPYIGSTDWTDKFIIKLGLTKLEKKYKFPVIGFIYFILISISIILSIHFGK